MVVDIGKTVWNPIKRGRAVKRFMYFSVAVLCLSISALIGFHLGSHTANAQVGTLTPFVSPDKNSFYVMDMNGDVWMQTAFVNGVQRCNGNFQVSEFCAASPLFVGNFWGGQPVPTSKSTIGGVKSKYR